MANGDLAQILVDKGHELLEQYSELLDQRAANRRSLRDLGAQGLLTEAQLADVDEMYPERHQLTDDERIKRAQENLKRAEKRAKEAAAAAAA